MEKETKEEINMKIKFEYLMSNWIGFVGSEGDKGGGDVHDNGGFAFGFIMGSSF